MPNVVVYGGAQAAVWELGKARQEPYEDIISRVTAPVLGIFGEDDFVVSVEDMRRLRAVLEDHRKSYEFTLFPHMPHGWMNSTMPGRYRPAESEKAWAMIIDFLERVSCGSFPVGPDSLELSVGYCTRLRLHQKGASGLRSGRDEG